MKKKITQAKFKQIRRWILRNSRPLEWARWQLLFEEGSPDKMMDVLRSYQNADGGFGWGLEPDSMNPQSSPYQTCIALNLCEDLGVDGQDSLIIGAFAYLSQPGTAYKDGWPFTIASNDKHPHAPWMGYDPKLNEEESFGLNLDLARHILTKDCSIPQLKAKAEAIVANSLTQLFTRTEFGEMGVEAYCAWLPLLEQMPKSIYTADQIQAQITSLIEKRVEKDPEQWQYYKPRPSYFVRSKNDLFYPLFQDLIETELDYLIDTCPEDDVWEIPWSWFGLYPQDFQVSRNWWKGWKAIENLLLLEAFDRIEPKSEGKESQEE